MLLFGLQSPELAVPRSDSRRRTDSAGSLAVWCGWQLSVIFYSVQNSSQGAESVSCQGGVGTSLCHLAGGSTCLCTAELGLLPRVWLSLAGPTQAVQTVAATVHVTIQAVGYLGLSAPSARSQAPHGAPAWGWCPLALLPSFSLRKPGLSMTCEATRSSLITFSLTY